jgi:hypothetical protein
MEEVFFLERENRKYGIKISNERVIQREGSLERTILTKSIDSFKMLDNYWSGVIYIIFGIIFFVVAVILGAILVGQELIITAISGSLSLTFFITGILYLTTYRFSLEVSAISDKKMKFPVSSFGNNYEIQKAIRNAILYKPNGSEKLMNNPAASGENEPPKRLEAYGNVASKPPNKETSTTYNISQELRSKYAADMEHIAEELKIRNATFETLVKERFDEITARTDVILKEARMQFEREKESQGTTQPPQAERNEPPNKTKEITQSDCKNQKSNKKEEKKTDDWLLDSKAQKSNRKTADWKI